VRTLDHKVHLCTGNLILPTLICILPTWEILAVDRHLIWTSSLHMQPLINRVNHCRNSNIGLQKFLNPLHDRFKREYAGRGRPGSGAERQ
jgi:hypothetical protein